MERRRSTVVRTAQVVVLSLVVVALARPVLAHGGSLGRAARDSLSVPPWLVVLTGGAVVGASFLLASFATDRAFVAAIHAPRRRFSLPGERTVAGVAGAFGVVVLVGVVAVGFVGPTDPLSNGAVVLVWVGWWAGFAMATYLVGNVWPAVNPWRAIAEALPSIGRTYPWRWGAWLSVPGLLALVWVEVVSPLADRPEILAVTVLSYSVVTIGGAVVYGPAQWFGQVDPVSRVFRLYGHVAPVGREGGSIVLRPPSGALTRDLVSGRGEVAFVVALLWVTTYDGLVTTPLWEGAVRWVVGLGVPPVVVYPTALAGGFAVFWGVYLLAARIARRTAPTYVDASTLARRFAPPLLAIAAGYHLAHFLGFFVSLLPTLVQGVLSPLSTGEPVVFALPDWFGVVAIAAVLLGHVLAIAAAHAVAFELFPGRLQAVRSQYPFTAAMIGYTMVSLWVVTRPDVPPPFI